VANRDKRAAHEVVIEAQRMSGRWPRACPGGGRACPGGTRSGARP